MALQVIRKCENAACGLRFPAPVDDLRVAVCPMCEVGETRIVAELPDRGLPPSTSPGQAATRVVGVLDNVRSALNTGTILRAAEGAGVGHVHLCGFTPTPDNPKVAKSALGSEFSVAWSHHHDAVELADELRAAGTQLWALEVSADAEPLFEQSRPTSDEAIALFVGNEVTGVDPALIDCADRLVHLPMTGTKTSLNVGVAFGIAAYWLLHAPGH